MSQALPCAGVSRISAGSAPTTGLASARTRARACAGTEGEGVRLPRRKHLGNEAAEARPQARAGMRRGPDVEHIAKGRAVRTCPMAAGEGAQPEELVGRAHA